jgi:hypothetical protein
MLAVNFTEYSVEAATLPSYRNASAEDLQEEVPAYVKVFSTPCTAVTVSRLLAASQLFAADVAQLFKDGEWKKVQRIRDMVEFEHFTFIDAALSCTAGNLLGRVSVSGPRKFGFSEVIAS